MLSVNHLLVVLNRSFFEIDYFIEMQRTKPTLQRTEPHLQRTQPIFIENATQFYIERNPNLQKLNNSQIIQLIK